MFCASVSCSLKGVTVDKWNFDQCLYLVLYGTAVLQISDTAEVLLRAEGAGVCRGGWEWGQGGGARGTRLLPHIHLSIMRIVTFV